MTTRHCDECRHYNYMHTKDDEVCNKNHHPRFYVPKSPMDKNWGWKKKCKDFEQR